MEAIEFETDGKLLARYIPASAAWGSGLKFFSGDQEFVQVGTWGYDAGKKLCAHYHNRLERSVDWTQEVLYVRNGKLRATVSAVDSSEEHIVEMSDGDLLILLDGVHGYEILSEQTEVLEIKNGPYLGAEKDRTRI